MIFITVILLSALSDRVLLTAAPRETLRLGVLLSQEGIFDFSGLIPAIEIAIETIEADETLPFTFTYTYNDSMVSMASYCACISLYACMVVNYLHIYAAIGIVQHYITNI